MRNSYRKTNWSFSFFIFSQLPDYGHFRTTKKMIKIKDGDLFKEIIACFPDMWGCKTHLTLLSWYFHFWMRNMWRYSTRCKSLSFHIIRNAHGHSPVFSILSHSYASKLLCASILSVPRTAQHENLKRIENFLLQAAEKNKLYPRNGGLLSNLHFIGHKVKQN